MAAADQFLLEPMKIQCERALSAKIDTEVSEYFAIKFCQFQDLFPEEIVYMSQKDYMYYCVRNERNS